MKKLMLAMIISSASGLAVAGGDIIPKQFQGQWRTKEGCQSMVKTGADYTEYATKVTPKSIEGHEQGCELKRVVQSDIFDFTGSFRCSGEGEYSTERVTLQLRNGKLRDGNSPWLSRCK
jgi:hypothetical protein